MQQLAGRVIVRAPAIFIVDRVSTGVCSQGVLSFAARLGAGVPSDRSLPEVSTYLVRHLSICESLDDLGWHHPWLVMLRGVIGVLCDGHLE